MFKYLYLPCGQPDIDREAWVLSMLQPVSPREQDTEEPSRRESLPSWPRMVELLNSISIVKPWLRFTQTQP
jgi:hypothetical protein